MGRFFYELTVKGGRNHEKYGNFHSFLSAQSWPTLDYTGAPLRIASSSLPMQDFVTWVKNETGVNESDILVEEITHTSDNHDDYRDLIKRYFKVDL